MLRLAQQPEWETCPTCKGAGKVPAPPTLSVRTGINGFNARGAINVPGTGHPIPCPICKGKKVVWHHHPKQDQ